MRPRYLELEGLHSFREKQGIDFDVLGEAGLFGIFGPTGSGKSTILDAITLALYGNVQRAVRGTQGIINTNCQQARVSFTFDLLKGNERKTFRVERVYRRKKDSNTSVENKLSRLFEVAGGEEIILSDKAGEVTERIVELLGLTQEDFTRSVVLPQNHFQEFLLMEKSKKREMLERIFYLEKYGRQLTDKVSSNLAWVKSTLSAINGVLISLGDASPAALDSARKELECIEEKKNDAEAALKTAEQSLAKAREIKDLIEELEMIEVKEKEWLKGREENQEKLRRYEEALKTASLEEHIKRYRELKESIRATEEKAKALEAEIDKLKEYTETLSSNYQAMRAEYELKQPKLLEKKASLNQALLVAAEIRNIDEKLEEFRKNYRELQAKSREANQCFEEKKGILLRIENDIQSIKSKIEKLRIDADYRKSIQTGVYIEEELKKLYKERENLSGVLSQEIETIRELESELGLLESEKRELESAYANLEERQMEHQKACPGDRDAILSGLNEYHSLKQLCESFIRQCQDFADKHRQRTELERKLQEIRESCIKAGQALIQLKEKRDEANRAYADLRRKWENNSAAVLAGRLVEGQPCPVCGSTHHPSPANSMNAAIEAGNLDMLLSQAEAEAAAAESAYRAAELEAARQGELMKALEEQAAGFIDEQNKVLRSLKDQWDNLKIQSNWISGAAAGGAASPPAFNFPYPGQMRTEEADYTIISVLSLLPDYLDGQLNKLKEELEGRNNALSQWEKDKEALISEIQKIREKISDVEIRIQGKKAEKAVHERNHESGAGDLEKLDLQLQNMEDNLKERIKSLGIDSFIKESEMLEVRDKQLAALERELAEKDKEYRDVRQQLDQLTDRKSVLEREIASLTTTGRHWKEERDIRADKLKLMAEGLSDEESIKASIEAIDRKCAEMAEREKKAEEELKKARERLYGVEMEYSSAVSLLESYRSDSIKQQNWLKGQLAEKGFATLEDAECCMLSEQERQQIKKETDSYAQEGNNLKAQRNLIERKLGGRRLEKEEWDRIVRQHEEAVKRRDELLAQYEGLKNRFEILKRNNIRWTKLEAERRKYVSRQDRLEQLQKLLKGNAFVEFISEERLGYVAREASETLGELTRYKYSLELDPDSGFVIRDHANGGVVRSVTTLSGGETFLTSLSLALALSRQIQLKGQSPLEFFFLDEGFGTLDQNLLDTVIDALERLGSRERVIGLISHVSELKSRIPRQLIVEPPNPAEEKGSRVRLCKI